MNCEYCESQKFSIIKFQDKSYPKIKFTGDQNIEAFTGDQNIEAFSENIVDQTNDFLKNEYGMILFVLLFILLFACATKYLIFQQ